MGDAYSIRLDGQNGVSIEETENQESILVVFLEISPRFHFIVTAQ